MVNIWVVSDTHFDHAKMVHTFVRSDGSPARAFASVEHMNEYMIERWNARVKPADHVYHLGDVTMHRKVATIQHRVLNRLQGHKRLLLGNHDLDQVQNYLPWFEKIMAIRVLDNIVFTHVPIHPRSVGRFRANVHGHTHHEVIPPAVAPGTPKDRRVPYINVCVEQTAYRPLHLDEIRERIARA